LLYIRAKTTYISSGGAPVVGKQPEKKPFGRDGPPKGYPKDRSLYADPENWRYPLHTSWHVRAARRYFDDAANRNKYSKEEQAYIDWRINEALAKSATVAQKRRSREQPSPPSSPSQIDALSFHDLLTLFLGRARMERARQMDDSLVSITLENSDVIEGRVKEYVIRIDIPNRTILHDCQDWRNNMASKMMCKHLGKLLMMLDEGKSANILRQVMKERDRWSFISPNDGAD
jgi:hypothetical protein